jgi:hypothetical protein
MQEGCGNIFSILCYYGAVGASAAGVRPATNQSSLHLFSIGYEALVFEAWADTNAGM